MPQWWAPEGVEEGRSAEDDAQFGLMLGAIPDLYLTARVHILLDTMYSTRFWTLMEAWCATKTATADGVRAATEADGRYTIECLHNAATTADLSSKQLVDLVLRKTPQEMRDILASADCAVTNMKDKETMLPVVGQTDEHVKKMMAASGGGGGGAALEA